LLESLNLVEVLKLSHTIEETEEQWNQAVDRNPFEARTKNMPNVAFLIIGPVESPLVVQEVCNAGTVDRNQ